VINLNIPPLSKESVMYIVGGGLALAVICGAYLGGVSLGAQEAAEQLQEQIDKLTVDLSTKEGELTQAQADLAGCLAKQVGDCILRCEPVCRERVAETVRNMEALCTDSH
jgi:hypothetical protein